MTPVCKTVLAIGYYGNSMVIWKHTHVAIPGNGNLKCILVHKLTQTCDFTQCNTSNRLAAINSVYNYGCLLPMMVWSNFWVKGYQLVGWQC